MCSLKTNLWIFRVASRPEVGGGHVMRSISLARVLNKYVDVCFVLDQGGEFWLPHILKYGFDAEIIGDYEGIDLSSPNLHQYNSISVLVDSYDFNESDLLKWKINCVKLAVIDDFGTAPDIVDYVISPSLSKYKNTCNKRKAMFGPLYSLLSPEYSQTIKPHDYSFVNTILLAFGYYDSKNCTEIVLDALHEIGFRGTVKIAIGSNAPHLSIIKTKLSSYTFKTIISEDVVGIYDLISNSDLVIGAGGVSLLERMALGKPSITFIVADNQEAQVKWAESFGATISIYLNECMFVNIITMINSLMVDSKLRHEMSNIAKSMIDGKGAMRVAEILISKTNKEEELHV